MSANTWTHAICDECFEERSPGREPVRLTLVEDERCCFCLRETTSGIYIRANPRFTRCDKKEET